MLSVFNRTKGGCLSDLKVEDYGFTGVTGCGTDEKKGNCLNHKTAVCNLFILKAYLSFINPRLETWISFCFYFWSKGKVLSNAGNTSECL